MYEDQKTGVSEQVMETPVSSTATEKIDRLLSQLESKLVNVLKPDNTAKEVSSSPEQSKSNLMSDLGYIQNRLNSILERLHV